MREKPIKVGERQVVESTKWTDDDWSDMQAAVESMGSVIDDLAGASWTAPRIAADVFTGLMRPAAPMRDEADVAPSYRVNREVFSELADTAERRRL